MQNHLMTLCSNHAISGLAIRNRKKYRTEAACPMIIYGCSTGMPPIQVRMMILAIRVQNRNCAAGRNVRARCLDV